MLRCNEKQIYTTKIVKKLKKKMLDKHTVNINLYEIRYKKLLYYKYGTLNSRNCRANLTRGETRLMEHLLYLWVVLGSSYLYGKQLPEDVYIKLLSMRNPLVGGSARLLIMPK